MSLEQKLFNQISKGIKTGDARLIKDAGETAYNNGLFFEWDSESGRVYLEDDVLSYNPGETF